MCIRDRLDSGHEVCVWPDISGISCLVANTGPQGNTLQHSIDGIHFSKITNLKCPKAPGPFRKDNYNENNELLDEINLKGLSEIEVQYNIYKHNI